MGTFEHRISVSNGNGGEVHTVLALVDTGATFSFLPASLLRDKLHIPVERQEVFRYANGVKSTLDVGYASFEVAGRVAPSPVVFGAEDQYLLGATSLQTLSLIADTSNHTLMPTPELLG